MVQPVNTIISVFPYTASGDGPQVNTAYVN